MNAMKVIETLDRLKPSAIYESDVISFINMLEADVSKNILLVPYEEITASTKTKELLVEPPYDGIYFEYVASKIDMLNSDIESYSLSSAQFNNTFTEYAKHIIRTKPRAPYQRTNYY